MQQPAPGAPPSRRRVPQRTSSRALVPGLALVIAAGLAAAGAAVFSDQRTVLRSVTSVRVDLLAPAAGGLALVLALAVSVRILRRRRRLGEALRGAPERDALTGLASRHALFAEAAPRLADPRWGGYALLHLDLDGFRAINDECGHHVGDAALTAFAEACAAAVRGPRDQVARLGGDEFAVMLYRLSDPRAEAEAVLARLRERLARPIDLGGRRKRLHFSAGVAVATDPVALEQLLVETDLALMKAKEGGRDGCEVFRRGVRSAVVRELRQALDAREVRCAFQPQVDLETGAVIGLEALARWHTADGSRVPPERLVEALVWLGEARRWLGQVVEETGRLWGRLGPGWGGRLWVNLTHADLREVEADDLVELLAGGETPLRRLGVEITEPILRPDRALACAKLERLRDAGVAVALDDMGNDRMPLPHVIDLPIDVVKLDRTLISGIDRRRALRDLVEALVHLCARRSLRVIAEGVERLEEEAVLRSLGVRYVQGFRFGRPLPAAAIPGLLSEAADLRLEDTATGGAA